MTFMETWRVRDRVVFDQSMVPWLLGVSNNLISNYQRSARRYMAMLARLPHAPSADTDSGDKALSSLDGELSIRAIERALRRLSMGERDVVRLCALAGVSYVDAASILDLPVGTVKSRLSWARQRLRHHLNPATQVRGLSSSAKPTLSNGEG